MNINIHVVGVHSMNFCSQFVGAVRDCQRSEVFVSQLSFLTVRDSKFAAAAR